MLVCKFSKRYCNLLILSFFSSVICFYFINYLKELNEHLLDGHAQVSINDLFMWLTFHVDRAKLRLLKWFSRRWVLTKLSSYSPLLKLAYKKLTTTKTSSLASSISQVIMFLNKTKWAGYKSVVLLFTWLMLNNKTTRTPVKDLLIWSCKLLKCQATSSMKFSSTK